MDLAERTRSFLAASGAGFLAAGCSARHDGATAEAEALAGRLKDAVVEDLAVKRNLVFIQWRKSETHGAAVLAWDQDGRVTALDVWG